MTSAIDPNVPVTGNPTTASVRANFLAAKAEIEALQAATGFEFPLGTVIMDQATSPTDPADYLGYGLWGYYETAIGGINTRVWVRNTTGGQIDTLGAYVTLLTGYGGITDEKGHSISSASNVVWTGPDMVYTNGRILFNSTADFNPGTQDFCFEAWINTTTKTIDGDASRTIFCSDNTLQMYLGVGTGYLNACGMAGSVDLATGADHFVAVTRASGALSLYVDSTRVASATNAAAMGSNTLNLGSYSNGNGKFNGLLQQVRFTIGAARYTGATITPPAHI